MRLWLRSEQVQELLHFSHEGYPCEVCGLLAGTREEIKQVIPIANTADAPHQQYHMDEQAFIKAMFSLNKSGLTLVGFYHSHPNSHPVPSSVDIRQALYPDTPYLIIGLQQREAELAAWSIRYGEVSRVEVYIGNKKPTEPEAALSKAQKTAIILSAVLVFIFMIVVSLSLLPPAPLIVAPLAK